MLGHVVLPIILDPARAHCCTGRRSFLGQPTRLCRREGRAGEGGGGRSACELGFGKVL